MHNSWTVCAVMAKLVPTTCFTIPAIAVLHRPCRTQLHFCKGRVYEAMIFNLAHTWYMVFLRHHGNRSSSREPLARETFCSSCCRNAHLQMLGPRTRIWTTGARNLYVVIILASSDNQSWLFTPCLYNNPSKQAANWMQTDYSKGLP